MVAASYRIPALATSAMPRWLPLAQDGFLPQLRVVMVVFRGKMLAALETAVRGGSSACLLG